MERRQMRSRQDLLLGADRVRDGGIPERGPRGPAERVEEVQASQRRSGQHYQFGIVQSRLERIRGFVDDTVVNGLFYGRAGPAPGCDSPGFRGARLSLAERLRNGTADQTEADDRYSHFALMEPWRRRHESPEPPKPGSAGLLAVSPQQPGGCGHFA